MAKSLNQLKDIEEKIQSKVKREIDSWWAAQGRDNYAKFYLYYKTGNFKIAKRAPSGYKRASEKCISVAWSKDQAYRFVEGAVRNLPILPLK